MKIRLHRLNDDSFLRVRFRGSKATYSSGGVVVSLIASALSLVSAIWFFGSSREGAVGALSRDLSFPLTMILLGLGQIQVMSFVQAGKPGDPVALQRWIEAHPRYEVWRRILRILCAISILGSVGLLVRVGFDHL